MKTKNKLMMTLMLALLLPVTAVALPPYGYTNYEFAVDGIYYKIVDNEACVTFQQYSSGMHLSDYHGDVVIPAQVTYRDVTYPVTTIDYYAFNYCQGLTSITIPESITTIKDCAFYLCTSLTSVNLLSPTVTIENNAFAECRALTTITCTSTTPPAMYYENCFDSPHYQNATLHVPASAVESYRNAPVWKKFVHIIADATTETPDNEDSYEYVPFVREGVKWVCYYDNPTHVTESPDFDGHFIPYGMHYYTLELKGDTIINGKSYKPLHLYSGQDINEDCDSVPVYLREENKVV
ncbi:MAG: leucine-rich repeat domain-containing protein, partial [Muribaculaceae bacterium]|nr:leucine-rich repeat domain-containing protein [Muribaculaceae bacterium]